MQREEASLFVFPRYIGILIIVINGVVMLFEIIVDAFLTLSVVWPLGFS